MGIGSLVVTGYTRPFATLFIYYLVNTKNVRIEIGVAASPSSKFSWVADAQTLPRFKITPPKPRSPTPRSLGSVVIM